MTTPDRIEEARQRQATRGRLRWLLEDFCSRELGPTLRPGEFLDLVDDVRAFAEVPDADVSQEDLQRLHAKIRLGLLAVFQLKPWVLESIGMVLEARSTSRGKSQKLLKMDLKQGKDRLLLRLPLPLQLRLTPPVGSSPKPWSLEDRFRFAAARELEGAWHKGKSLVGWCAREACKRFFYRVKRQTFCSFRCKQLAMDERKAKGRSAPGRRPDAGRATRKGP